MYGILYNPISGRGLGRNYADQISDYFSVNGEQVLLKESNPSRIDEDFLKDISGLIVVGGDGTIRPLFPILAKLQIPVTLFPAGNESLIAKQFLINKNIPELYDRVKSNNPTLHHFGIVNGEPFFLMCSVGFDAEVVHWVKRHRTAHSSDMLYLEGILASIFKIPSSFGLACNNQTSFSGTIIIANSPFYGGSVTPVPDADSGEGKLRVRYFIGSYLKLFFKFVFMRVGIDKFEGSEELENLEIKSIGNEEIRFQIDGEAMIDNGGCLKIQASLERVSFY